MARKDKHTKITHATHVKRHTLGTSNELSFSVLEAAKDAADAESGKDGKRKTPHFGGISLFTLPGRKKKRSTPAKDNVLPLSDEAVRASSTGSSTPTVITPESTKTRYEMPVDEIARRKSRRRGRRIVVAAVFIVAAFGLAAAGISFLYQEHTVRNERLSLIDAALADLSATDEILVEMDAVIMSDMDESEQAKAAELSPRLPEVSATLDTAEQAIQQADVGMTSASDKEAIARALAAVSTRRDMVEQGGLLMSEGIAVRRAEDAMTGAWENVLGADKLSRDAADLVIDTTEHNVTQSRELSVQARDLFAAALTEIRSANDVYPEADVAAQVAYIEKRIEAMDFAIASDDAILAFNKEDAASANDAYNSADAEAAALVESLPESPAQPIHDAYTHETATARKLYDEARSRAATADAFLRDYLGTSDK